MATTASAVINTTDTGSGTPTVPDASVTTKWQEYIWVRHLEAANTNKAKVYVWNPNATSVATYLKWQEVAAAGAFSDLTGAATIAQLPTGITVSNLSIDGAITNTHLAGSIANDKLAGGITYGKITSVDAAAVTSVSNSKIPVNTIPTGLTNTNIDSILGAASVDYDKLNITDGTIPGAKIKDSLVHGQIDSVNATKITTGTLPPARLEYMFERNLPILTIGGTQGSNSDWTANLHTLLGANPFEGLIRIQATASTNELIIALPNPDTTAYNGKAAKLSIYRGSSTGKVTIKVCNSGTNSSAFASDKIVDNNNGEITDQVTVLPQLTTAGARKVVVDLLADQVSGDGQWIITGGAPATGKGKVSVEGCKVGGGTDAAPDTGAMITSIGLGGVTPMPEKAPVRRKLNTAGDSGAEAGTPVADKAFIYNYAIIDIGSGYSDGQLVTVDTMNGTGEAWATEPVWVINFADTATLTPDYGNRTRSIAHEQWDEQPSGTQLQGVYGGTNHYSDGSGQKAVKCLLKYASSNTITNNHSNSPHATFLVWLQGKQPLGNDGQVLQEGMEWFDPWMGTTNTVGP